MIDIKVIKKPKNEGSTSALRTSGTAYGGMAVKEAAHAAKADIAELAKEAIHAKDSDHAIEADHSKEADHAVNADESKHALEADHAKEADNADKWDYREFDDYLNQPVRKTDGVTFDSVTSDSIRSAGQFVDGMLGTGFQLWKGEDGRTYLTVDKLTVRQTMAVMELLIEKVRSVGGQICVSAANGRIKTVEESGELYLITFEQENMFVQHDLVRCQTFTGKDMRSYWVEVTDVTETGIVVAKEEFEGVEPKEGDECVLMGNTANTDRQNMVLISATEDGQPRVDVMDGVNGKTFANCLRARLGNLDGIKDDKFPADRQPKGNGLYADNAFMKGTFVLETGEDVKTRFEITEGKVQSAIDSVRNDFLSEKGYLNNPTFASGLEKWNSENETVFFLVGNRWVWANGAALSKKGDGASVVTDMGRKVVRIRNKYIRQKHENLRYVPTFPTNGDGKKEALPVYLSFFYRCAKSGMLKIGFENVDKTGFADFNSMEVSEEIAATGGYVQYTCSGLWNGTGDFKLSFDGDIYLYMLVLSTDKIEALTYKYKTLFEQSERLVKISAAVYDKDERALQETGLIVTSNVSGLYAIDVDGNLKSFVGAGQDGVKIKATNIQLEGLVTANENFKILEDGSIQTIKAVIQRSELTDVRINGAIRTPFRDGYYEMSNDGWISVSTPGLQNNNNVVIPGSNDGWNTAVTIPFSSEYNGFRAIVMNDNWGSETSGGAWSHTAPDGMYYFENGQRKKTLIVNPHAGVEMIGYGEGDKFKGWLVLNRIYSHENHLGFPLHIMFSGRVTASGVMQGLKTYNGEKLTATKIDTGKYRINFGNPFSSIDNYMVFLTGESPVDSHGLYASVYARNTTYFDVYTGDDASANDGAFQFIVINTAPAYCDQTIEAQQLNL